MPGSLDDWQERLAQHFGELSLKRESLGFPIFALEHGLSVEELRELTSLLHAYLRGPQRLWPYWLLWVVYATEQGYGYEGHEYWVSFEHNTPHWRDRGSARGLRTYFEKFQQTYNGVVPSGPWAEWFRNIAGPITHAILPKYLQDQFASALYDARHQFARMQNPTPAAAGRVLSSNAWDATSRLREFLEQEELAGRLALALLDYGITQGVSPIYEATLKRIVEDLSKIRLAGERLRDTRKFVADRFHGVDRSSGSVFNREPSAARSHETSEPYSVRPTLILRQSTESAWAVVAAVPSFGSIARLNPDLSRFLKSTRCSLAGTEGAMLPAGWTLYGSKRRVLKAWPPAGGLMIAFEKRNALLENILGRECRFAQGPIWLFRVASDGVAYEVTNRTVRAGQTYLVISRNPLKLDLKFATDANIQCSGVCAVALALPADGIEAHHTAELRKIGIEVSRNIRLWPAGLSIRNWDGDGHGEWLSTETPCFGIVHDYAVDEYSVRLDGGSELRIDGARAGHPVFVRLPQLAPGRHSLTVRAKRLGLPIGSAALKDLDGKIDLKVRDPSPWKPGTVSHSGLAIAVDPPDPTLDAFWEGNVRVSVFGPEGHDVTCSISLTGRDGQNILSESVGKFDLPITDASWTRRFKQFASDISRGWKYLDASKGRFTVRGDELGEFILPLERSASPVRWLCRMTPQSAEVRLLDDSGRESELKAQFFPFKRPGTAEDLDIETVVKGISVGEPGGLFFATQGELRDLLLVSSSRGASGFADLIVTPDLSGLSPEPIQVLVLIDLWQRARVAGTLVDSRRDHIIRSLLDRLYLLLCGSRWSHAESAFFRNHPTGDLSQLERAIDTRAGFPAALRHNRKQLEKGTIAATQWFADAAKRYGICDDAKLCGFALRLASKPFDLATVYGDQLTVLLTELMANAVLMRAARYLALLSVADAAEQPTPLLPRWEW